MQRFTTRWIAENGNPEQGISGMPDTPNLADGSGPVPSTGEALARPRRDHGRGDDDPAGDPAGASRSGRRRAGAAVHRVVAACADGCQRSELGVRRRQDPAIKRKLGRRYRQIWNIYYRSVIRKVAESDDSMAKTARAVQWQVDHFEEIPVLVVACLKLHGQGGRVPYLPMPHAAVSGFFGSIYPSVQNLLLAARSMGLGASLITLPLWSLASARHILGLPTSVTPCCIVPLGWPRGRYGPTTRRPVGEVVHLDRYGNRAWLQN